MRRLVIAGMAVFFAVAGCTPMKTTTHATPDASPSAAPAPPVPPPAPPPSATAPSVPPGQPAPASEPDASSASAGAAPAKAPARSKTDSRPVKGTGAPAESSHGAASAAPAVKPPSAPTLNLADLEQRLRDTRAIGVFTKLSLKNQVDDLLGAFRDLYKGPNKQPPPELRQRYDQLLVKVLSLLQQGDPPLAQAIASSREAIWSILADPDKFEKI